MSNRKIYRENQQICRWTLFKRPSISIKSKNYTPKENFFKKWSNDYLLDLDPVELICMLALKIVEYAKYKLCPNKVWKTVDATHVILM